MGFAPMAHQEREAVVVAPESRIHLKSGASFFVTPVAMMPILDGAPRRSTPALLEV
jgi:hypothetical protein